MNATLISGATTAKTMLTAIDAPVVNGDRVAIVKEPNGNRYPVTLRNLRAMYPD
jgi:hypothetical protein